ncbi:hypothetical protein LP421_07590 [Rhizobium sp. RCAM05350]|nr:hypothetical protein LP421_07590 [Rhizobium sp. RCAM05350]
MQQFARRQSPSKDAFAPATSDRSSLSGAITRLAAVFVCAGAVQILAGWILR